MSGVDLTVALTSHAETVVAGPTLRSVEAAIEAAEQAGYRVERLGGLDAPTAATRTFFGQPALGKWRLAEFEYRDQGRVRNSLAEQATGRWIAFVDADDLFSENWLVEGCRRLARASSDGERIVVHPELNWIFDHQASVLLNLSQDEPLFSPHYLYFGNYYDAMCVAPREAHLALPFADRRLADGFAYEDWQWAIESMAAGWRHVVAPDTIIFKRRRAVSQTIRASQGAALYRALEPMAIDCVASLAEPVAVVQAAVRDGAVATPLQRAPSSPLGARETIALLAKGRIGVVREYRRVRKSGAFDATYYLDRNEDVRRSGMNPLLHYLVHGAREGRRTLPRPANRSGEPRLRGRAAWMRPSRRRESGIAPA